jgi:hypothetical protein
LIAALVAASLYISKRRVNLAGLGIGVVSQSFAVPQSRSLRGAAVCGHCVSDPTSGPPSACSKLRLMIVVVVGRLQDFLQILSMFSNMDFEWPAALLALYRVFSLVNFNLELLAPECSFAVNFEQKWFVTQLLPLILGASILLVLAATKVLQWIQRVLFKVLPFGATMDTNLVDICIGIFITGVFHLYLCKSTPLSCDGCACAFLTPVVACCRWLCSCGTIAPDAIPMHRRRCGACNEGRADDPVRPRRCPWAHGQDGVPVARAVRRRRPRGVCFHHVAISCGDRGGPAAARAGQG